MGFQQEWFKWVYIMRNVVGIDVSSEWLNWALVSDEGELIDEDVVDNNSYGLREIEKVIMSYAAEVIFEATGVYSRRLQRWFEDLDWPYVMLNPLEAKKGMDSLRKTKTDLIDARKLAELQIRSPYKTTMRKGVMYREIEYHYRDYEENGQKLVNEKNRVQTMLQDTFPELIELFKKRSQQPDVFYKIALQFPHADYVLESTKDELNEKLKNTIRIKREKKIEELIQLADKSAPGEDRDSYLVKSIKIHCQRVIDLIDERTLLFEEMQRIMSTLPEHDILTSIPGLGELSAIGLVAHLGDIRRFSTPSKLKAFVGLDVRHNDSGKHKTTGYISKKGNSMTRKLLYNIVIAMIGVSRRKFGEPNRVVNYYERKTKTIKKGKKKYIVGAMDRLLRMIHHMVINSEMYAY